MKVLLRLKIRHKSQVQFLVDLDYFCIESIPQKHSKFKDKLFVLF